MSGVIDKNGVQWEHCNLCAKFVMIHGLNYEPPSKRFRYGRDLCDACYYSERYKTGLEPPHYPVPCTMEQAYWYDHETWCAVN